MNVSEQAEACPTKTTCRPTPITPRSSRLPAPPPHNTIRYEPAFRTRYVAPLGLPPTEEVARSISWGLMQVMGQVAREHSFTAKSLAALCDPATGLAIGCAVFAAKLRASANDAASAANNGDAASVAANVVERALELWNGGANTSYAAQVLARVAYYR